MVSWSEVSFWLFFWNDIFNDKFETIEVDGQKKTKLKEALTMDECQYIWLELWKLKNDMVTTLSAEYPELGADK